MDQEITLKKKCAGCKNTKSLSDFTIDNSRSDGHYAYCKGCLSAISKSRRANEVSVFRSSFPERFELYDGEIFKDIPGYKGKYQVSNLGRIRSLTTKKGLILKTQKTARGYVNVCLSLGNKKKYPSVHSLALLAFVSDRPEGYVVNHKDGRKDNNILENLEWVTQSENARHSYEVLGHPYQIPPRYTGESHPGARLTRDKVDHIRSMYSSGGCSSRSLAKIFGVSKVSILNIVNNKLWKG